MGVEPLSHPLLQAGCALTEGLSALEEQRGELEITDRRGYGLDRPAVPRETEDDCRSRWIVTPTLTAL